jgi:hypothetical protein
VRIGRDYFDSETLFLTSDVTPRSREVQLTEDEAQRIRHAFDEYDAVQELLEERWRAGKP